MLPKAAARQANLCGTLLEFSSSQSHLDSRCIKTYGFRISSPNRLGVGIFVTTFRRHDCAVQTLSEALIGS
jgi:hypothetical protein